MSKTNNLSRRDFVKTAGAAAAAVAIDHLVVEKIVAEQRGIPFPVLRGHRPPDRYLASVRVVENTVRVAVAEETARLAEPAVNASR